MKAFQLAPVVAVILLAALGNMARASTDVAVTEEAKVARAEAGSAIAAIDVTANRVSEQLRSARARGDQPRAQCESAALSMADASSRSARLSAQAAQDAYARGDAKGGRAWMAAVIRAEQGANRALEASTMCWGPNAIQAPVESTTVRVVIDPNIAADEK